MKKNDVPLLVKKFLCESETFRGICFSGLYAMDLDIFFKALEEYIKSGENHLDEYTEINSLYYDFLHDEEIGSRYSLDQLIHFENLLDNKGFWDICCVYSEQEIEQIKNVILCFKAEIYKKQKKLETSDYRNTKEYKSWRSAVFERDNFTCTECKQKGGDLEAHHIESFKKYPKRRYKIDNGITLCRLCHKELHKKQNKKNKGFGNNALV
ncbi:MAG: HNH endonuclease [Patescibacteria group bacterium]|nr:HNH endonuclease [Patescibacteria group bacterium]